MGFGFQPVTDGGGDGDMESVTIQLRTFGQTVSHDVDVPTGPTHPRRMLPVFQALAQTLIDDAVAQEVTAGNSISCKRGCDAGRRQLVPLPPAEAHAMRALVEALPEPTQTQVLERFAEAGKRIERSALGARLRDQVWDDEDESHYNKLALDYFALGIPCPFLDAEGACSIYSDCPIVCREFLVITPRRIAPTRRQERSRPYRCLGRCRGRSRA